MRFPCFSNPGDVLDSVVEAPRKRTIKRSSTADSSKSTGSRASTVSNSSISRLPPCDRGSPQLEAMMMPLPEEARASRCLRLSQPKTYSNIIDSMKASKKGCRDWKSFPVFFDDEVDMAVSADERARRKTADHERRLQQLSSFGDDDDARPSIDMDMIG